MHLDKDEIQQRQTIATWKAEKTWDGIHDLESRIDYRRRMEFLDYCREELRRAQRLGWLLDEEGNSRLEDAIEASVTPADVVSRVLIQSAIEQLKPREQEMLTLFYFQGWSQAEIARKYGIGESRVSQIFKHAYGRMKGYLCQSSSSQSSLAR